MAQGTWPWTRDAWCLGLWGAYSLETVALWSQVKVEQMAMELRLTPLTVLLRSVLEQLQDKDPAKIFAQPVSLKEVRVAICPVSVTGDPSLVCPVLVLMVYVCVGSQKVTHSMAQCGGPGWQSAPWPSMLVAGCSSSKGTGLRRVPAGAGGVSTWPSVGCMHIVGVGVGSLRHHP